MTGNATQILAYLMAQEDRDKLWDLVEHKEKRSLDANAYFHVLCDKLRKKLNMSMARCKNHLIASYGQIEYIDGEPMIYKTNAPEDYMMELEILHTKCVKVVKENQRNIYFYRVYRGSHTYNSAEFNLLLKGTIEDCKLQDIETATPNEIAKMVQLWEAKKGQQG